MPLLNNRPMFKLLEEDLLLRQLSKHSGSKKIKTDTQKPLPIPAVTDDGSRMLSQEAVVSALREVGLGDKLIIETLQQLGFEVISEH